MINDFTKSFEEIRPSLVSRISSVGYRDFRKKLLRVSFGKVWLDISLSWTLVLFLGYLSWLAVTPWVVALFLLAPLMGLGIHRISLFLHEGAHYLVAPKKKINDLLTNLFIGQFLLIDVRRYRKVHFLHHRHIGTAEDPENSYHQPLNWKFLFAGMFGISVLRVLRTRGESRADTSKLNYLLVPFVGSLFYLALFLMVAIQQNWKFFAVFVAGLAIFFPLSASVRQNLEHRPVSTGASAIMTPITRIFKRGAMSWFLGAAGFRLHLLHHWDPGISYTRLDEMYRYLAETELEKVLEERSFSYSSAFRDLWAWR